MTGNRRLIRNASFDFYCFSRGTDGQVVTGPTITSSKLSKDDAAFADTGTLVAESPASSGVMKIPLTATEMAFDVGFIKIAYSAGARPIEGFELATEPCIDSGVAQASASSYLTLRSGASAVDDTYNGFLVELVRGTGSSQKHRLILDYNGTTKQAAVWPAWDTTPDTTSVYKIVEAPPGLTNLALFYGTALRKFAAQSGSTDTILKTTLTGYGTNAFRNAVVIGVSAGSNQGFDRAVGSYDSSTGDLTLAAALPATPSTGDEFFLGGLIG